MILRQPKKFVFYFISYLHVVHDELEEPSQGAAFLLYTRIHFSTGSEKFSSTSQQANFFWAPVQTSLKKNVAPTADSMNAL